MHSYIIVEAMFNCCHSDGETTKKNYKEKQSIFFTFQKKIFFMYTNAVLN